MQGTLTFSDADPIMTCRCGVRCFGDSINDALIAWGSHLTTMHREDWNIPDEPLTAGRAALMAATVLESAYDCCHDPEGSAALVQVADAWTRLHTALANAKQPATVNVESMSIVDDDVKTFSTEFEKRITASWPRLDRTQVLTLPIKPAYPPIVRAGGADHEVVGWNVKVGPEGVGYIELQVVKLDRKR